MPSAPNPKRTQPTPAAPRSGAPNKSHNASKAPKASPESGSPPSGHSAPYSDTSRSSKKLTKAVRGGGGHGGGSGNKGTMKNKTRNVGDGPEAELSDGSVDTVYWDEHNVRQREEEAAMLKERVPKNEIDIGTLLAEAKQRPESHNISRGYEMITSPAARPVIPFDRALIDRARAARHDSISSSTGFTDESEWENIQFGMDGMDGFTRVPTTTSVKVNGPKLAYADVVKRPIASPVATASA